MNYRHDPQRFGKSKIGKILRENSEALEKVGINIYFPNPTDKIGGLNISHVYTNEDWVFKLWMKK